jgi:hypothetical protein
MPFGWKDVIFFVLKAATGENNFDLICVGVFKRKLLNYRYSFRSYMNVNVIHYEIFYS